MKTASELWNIWKAARNTEQGFADIYNAGRADQKAQDKAENAAKTATSCEHCPEDGGGCNVCQDHGLDLGDFPDAAAWQSHG